MQLSGYCPQNWTFKCKLNEHKQKWHNISTCESTDNIIHCFFSQTLKQKSCIDYVSVLTSKLCPLLSGLSFYSRVAENCEDVAHFNEVSVFISSAVRHRPPP